MENERRAVDRAALPVVQSLRRGKGGLGERQTLHKRWQATVKRATAHSKSPQIGIETSVAQGGYPLTGRENARPNSAAGGTLRPSFAPYPASGSSLPSGGPCRR
jgi:hypothetical protein